MTGYDLLVIQDNQMILSKTSTDGTVISVQLSSTRRDYQIWYRLPEELHPLDATDSFLIASLIPAMAAGPKPGRARPAPDPTKPRLLRCTNPVSDRLLGAIPMIQDILLTWDKNLWAVKYPEHRRLRRVIVEADPSYQPMAQGAGTASFFSAGVDSCYTALKHLDELEALIFVGGFDVKPDEALSFAQALSTVRRAAGALNKPLIEIASNIHRFGRRFVPWSTYHGAALASAATLLSKRFRKILIPATTTYDNLIPLGSHPLLDPLWSTESVEIVHDGAKATRIEKLAAIADHPAVRSNLRVCLEEPQHSINCSRCEKCLRTMIQLRELGKLGNFSSFDPLDPDLSHFVNKPWAQDWERAWRRILRRLEASDRDPELQQMIGRVLQSSIASGRATARHGGRSGH